MTDHYRVEQGPGKALKVIAALNELVDGDTVSASDHGAAKAAEARMKFESMLDAMEKVDVISLYSSALALGHIVNSVEKTTEQHINTRWGLVQQ